MPGVRPEEIVGAPPWAGFSTPTLLGANSRPDATGRLPRSTRKPVPPIEGECSAARAVVAGGAGQRVPRPGNCRGRAAVVDHHLVVDHLATTVPSTPSSTADPTGGAPTSTTPKPDPDAFAALANQVSQNQQMLTQLSAQVDQATQQLAALGTEIDTTQQKLDATRAEMTRIRDMVRERAAYIYRHADTPGNAVVDIEHVQDINVGKKYAESATQTDTGRVDGLQKVSNQLDAQRKQLEATRARRSRTRRTACRTRRTRSKRSPRTRRSCSTRPARSR